MIAAGLQVKSFWANLFCKALAGQDINSLIRLGGAVGSAPQQVEEKKK